MLLKICTFHLLYLPVLSDLDSRISEGKAHAYIFGSRKSRKSEAERCFINTLWKLMEKEVNLIQSKIGMRKRSHTGALALLWLSTCELIHWEVTAYQLIHTDNILYFTVLCDASSRDICTHGHIWFSQQDIPGGGQEKSLLRWLVGKMRLRKGTKSSLKTIISPIFSETHTQIYSSCYYH